MREGKAVATVLHTDEVDIDYSAGYAEEAAAELDSHWRLWFFELEAETPRPIAGIEDVGSGFFLQGLGGRAPGGRWANFESRPFMFAPNLDWSRSSVFELDTGGNATKRFESAGFINDWIRVR